MTDISKDEKWVLDRILATRGGAISPKVLLGMWESTCPDRGVQPVRDAVKGLQQKA
jgi:hypothetical protein